MSYSVFIGDGGYTGWRLLTRSAEQQKALVAADPQVARDAEHFRNNIGQISRAEDLVADYRLLSVALKAHGLEADIGNRAFIRKVLESDLSDPKSLANKLSDSRYADLARSFGFSEAVPATLGDPQLADRIGAAHLRAEFELRVGEADNDLRIALHAQRELAEIARSDGSETGKWYRVLGSAPLAQFVQTAFGTGNNLAKLPIDSQVTALQSAARRYLGIFDMAQLAEPAVMERAIGLFLARADLDSGSTGRNRFAIALSLLS